MSTYASVLNGSERFLQSRPGILTNAMRLVVLALRVRRERNQLASQSDAILRDLGLTRADANREASRSLFDLPANRIAGY
jgi:uncharacterized protein YjiS (DUF1127 family)